MNRIILIVIIVIGLLIPERGVAQFILSCEFRPRTEFSHGYLSLAEKNQKTSVFTAQRTRLNLLYTSEFINTKLVLQDVRTWGSQSQLISNEDFATSVHEAWAEVFLSTDVSLKAGRQELVYDDHRIFGNVGWAHQARSHDVAILKYEKDIKLHLGIAHHENTNRTDNFFSGNDVYKNLQFIWFNKECNKKSLSLLVINNGKPFWNQENQKQETNYTQTIGGRVTLPLGKIKIATNLYYQTGESLSALNYLLELSAKAGSKGKLLAGLEILSGTDFDKSSEKNKSFTPLYGTNHKFNGYMDYFYVGNHINSVGLTDIYLKYAYAKNKFSFKSDLHIFSSAAKIDTDVSNYLGTELDLTIGITLRPAAKLSLGFSTLFASESMQILKKSGDHKAVQYWAYVMLSVTPTFIK